MTLYFIAAIVIFFCLVITIGLMRATWNIPVPFNITILIAYATVFSLIVLNLIYNIISYASKEGYTDFISLIASIIFTIIFIIASIVWEVKKGFFKSS
jgi:hypothetical protein